MAHQGDKGERNKERNLKTTKITSESQQQRKKNRFSDIISIGLHASQTKSGNIWMRNVRLLFITYDMHKHKKKCDETRSNTFRCWWLGRKRKLWLLYWCAPQAQNWIHPTAYASAHARIKAFCHWCEVYQCCCCCFLFSSHLFFFIIPSYFVLSSFASYFIWVFRIFSSHVYLFIFSKNRSLFLLRLYIHVIRDSFHRSCSWKIVFFVITSVCELLCLREYTQAETINTYAYTIFLNQFDFCVFTLINITIEKIWIISWVFRILQPTCQFSLFWPFIWSFTNLWWATDQFCI